MLLTRITVREIWSNRQSAILGSISMVACIAFITAVLIVSATVRHSFDGLFATTYAHSDAVVRSANKLEGEFGRDNRDEILDSLLDEVRATPGVAEAIGAIEGKALISTLDGVSAQPNDDLPEYGGIYVDSTLTPWQLMPGSRAPHGPTEVVIDSGAARAADIHVGDTVRVTTRIGPLRYVVVGIARFASGDSAGGATWALFDQVTAETVVSGGTGLLDEIRVRGDRSLNDLQLVANLQKSLAGRPDAEVLTGRQLTEESQGALGKTVQLFTSLALLFAGIATIAGSFIIAAALATSAARRELQHGLLRALGATRRQIATSTLLEAAALGAFGAIAGFVAGIGLARLVWRFLSAIGLVLPAPTIVVQPIVLLLDIGVAIVVSLAAGSVAALRSCRVPPLVAVRTGSIEPQIALGRRLAIIVASMLFAVIAFLEASDTTSSLWLLASLVALATAVVCAGALTIGRVGRLLSPGDSSRRDAARWLAARSLVGRPRRFALGNNAAMIAAALVVATATIGASANASLFDNFADQIRGDFLISSTKPSQQLDGIFPQSLLAEISALPQVDRATGVAYQRFTTLDSDGQQTRQVARVIDPSTVSDLVDLDFQSGSLQSLSTDGVLVSAGKARRDGLHLGDAVTATLLNGEVHVLHVEGIFLRDDLTNQVLDIHLFDTQSKPVDFGLIVVTKRPQSDSDTTAAALERVMADYASAQVQTRRDFLAGQSDQVEQYLHIVDALVALSIFVAVIGVGTMLMLSVRERGREFAVLRITGMTVRQLRRTVAWESLATCASGALQGIVVGLIAGWAFVRALRDRGLHHFSAPIGTVVIVLAASIAIGAIVSIWPARRAARIDALSQMTSH